ncbi:alpha/beta fold hydrolase [Flammeovirga kamogawensis]|uniref:Alpha/beta hydrolase n=1 Tax=Flammeovirga kamogawensis TaxID=373891 RepID=A0ABX8GY72_9BACT|nr:alpha/beta hydrolase [Flammeovirga kamogawensis]MBB6458988.1 pimeloyl-ACP methyl ester carboxylesterase [Flammeovirga kamogawensis]QWG08563.1 alpha/beta hydrolase [Flammeovirga kamogawensis]TRX66854.1 alpha/beta hydrolase [Flammeovirga kamogawensis]
MAYLAVNNQELYYADYGDKSAPPILFLHGFLMNSEMFDAQVAYLSSCYRVITLDARAFGKTKWDGQPFSLYDLVDDAISLLDHLSIERAILAGMSQGGYVALRAALKYPNRVNGLVLISTSGVVDPISIKEIYIESRDVWVNNGLVPPLHEGLMTGIIGPKETYEVYWDKWTPEWKKRTGEEIYHAMNALINRDDIEEFIKNITVPALIIHGEADQGVPYEEGLFLHNTLQKSVGVITIKEGCHTSIMTHSDTVNASLLYYLENDFTKTRETSRY